MKHSLLGTLVLAAMLCIPTAASAIDNNTVEVVYSGSTATVTIAPNISSYVTCSSGTSSHVVLVQSSTFAGVNATADNTDGEIIYVLSGTSTNGQFYVEGSYKCTVELKGLTLTCTDGPALCIMNGKRVSISAKSGTTSTLTDAANDTYKGCIHCKGHTKLKGKGTLNVKGNSAHAVYSKEYLEVKNLTLNITAAVKDGIHCKEYFLMESGTVKIGGVADDGIQVELDGQTSTGTTTGHEEEDTGNFYQAGGALTISSWGGKAVKADGTITRSSGTWTGFAASDCTENNIVGIDSPVSAVTASETVYDLQGRRIASGRTVRGMYIVTDGQSVRKVQLK